MPYSYDWEDLAGSDGMVWADCLVGSRDQLRFLRSTNEDYLYYLECNANKFTLQVSAMICRNALCSTAGGNADIERLGHGADEPSASRVCEAGQLHAGLHGVSPASDHITRHGTCRHLSYRRHLWPGRCRRPAATVRRHSAHTQTRLTILKASCYFISSARYVVQQEGRYREILMFCMWFTLLLC